MSYLDYFLKNIQKYDTQENAGKTSQEAINKDAKSNRKYYINNDEEKIRGSCHTMCPVDEERLRIREHMVHVLEKCGPDMKLVKSYSRSAADSNMMVPQHLRPYNILRVTVAYLLFEVTKKRNVPTHVVYDFINDRLRAVRQDMTIQRLPPGKCASLLEPMIRFYVYYGYRLYGLPLNDFDPVLHKNYLLECLKWFLSCCDNSKDCKDLEHYGDEDQTPSELEDLMKTMRIECTDKLACDQVLMESLYILCNLDNVHPLHRYLNLPKEFKKKPKLRLAFSIAVANMKGNFVKVTSMLSKLCPLSHCAFCQYLPDLQRRALRVLSVAYSSKSLCVCAATLARWLAFSGASHATRAARHYALPATSGATATVRFDRGMYKSDVTMHESNIRHLQGDTLNLSLPHVFTYTAE